MRRALCDVLDGTKHAVRRTLEAGDRALAHLLPHRQYGARARSARVKDRCARLPPTLARLATSNRSRDA